MLNDTYIWGRMFVPLIMIIILGLMTFVHRRQVFKYLYIMNILLYLVAIITYFILINHPVGQPFPYPWMTAIPFVWAISIFLAFGLSFASLSAFVIEQAQRHIWARILIGLVVLAIMIAIAIGIYYFIEIIRVIGYF
mgnify:FL=1